MRSSNKASSTYFYEAWKMTSRNRSKRIKQDSSNSSSMSKRRSSKNPIEINTEPDLRTPLFSLNSPIRCGTSGYSYKRLDNITHFT